MVNKKGQFPIVTFVVIVVGLIIIAPVMLKLFNTTKASVGAGLGNVSDSETGVNAFNKVMDIGINFWDKVLIAVFFLNLIILIISSFLIDTHPFWVILYIFVCFLLILFVPNIVDSLDQIYDSPQFALETSGLSFMNSLRIYFGEFIVGIFLLTGIIMYGKIRYIPAGSGGRPL